MRLRLDVAPELLLVEPADELALRAQRELAAWAGADELPVYTSDGLAVRIRLLHELPPLEVGMMPPTLPRTPALSTAGWFLALVLEGLLWREAAQVQELHVRREWTRPPGGVEVSL